MNVVFLDGASLPTPMERPTEATGWTVREKTALDQVVDVLADADVAITNKCVLAVRRWRSCHV